MTDTKGDVLPAVVENIERVFVDGRDDGSAVDASAFEGVQEWWSNGSRTDGNGAVAGGDGTRIEDIESLATVGMTGAHGTTGNNGNTDFEVQFDGDVTGSNDALDVVFDDVSGRSFDTTTNRDDGTTVDSTDTNNGNLIVEGFETFNVTSIGDSNAIGSIETGGDLETLNVEGAEDLTVSGDLDDSVTTVSAGDMSGDLSVNAGDVAVNEANTDFTATTGSGGDSVDLDTIQATKANSANATITVSTGQGDDTVEAPGLGGEATGDFEGTLNLDGGEGDDSIGLDIAGTANTNDFENFLNLDNVTLTNFEDADLDFAGDNDGLFDAGVIDGLSTIELNESDDSDNAFEVINASGVTEIEVDGDNSADNSVGNITVSDAEPDEFTLVLRGSNFPNVIPGGMGNEANVSADAGALDVDAETVTVSSKFTDAGNTADPDFDPTVTNKNVTNDSGLNADDVLQNTVQNIGASDNEAIRSVNLTGTMGVDITGTVFFADGVDGATNTLSFSTDAVGETDVGTLDLGDDNNELTITADGGTKDSRLGIGNEVKVDFIETITIDGQQDVTFASSLGAATPGDAGLSEIDASDSSGDIDLGDLNAASNSVGTGDNQLPSTPEGITFNLIGGDGELSGTLAPVADTHSGNEAQVIETGSGGSDITLSGFAQSNNNSNSIDFTGGSGDDAVTVDTTIGTVHGASSDDNTITIDGGDGDNSLTVDLGSDDAAASLTNVSNISVENSTGNLFLDYTDFLRDSLDGDVQVSDFGGSGIFFQAGDDNNTVDLSSDGAANIISNAQGGSTFGAAGDGSQNTLTGDDQDNILIGGAGADTLDGGAGSDTFVATTSANSSITATGDTAREFDLIENFVVADDGVQTVGAVNGVTAADFDTTAESTGTNVGGLAAGANFNTVLAALKADADSEFDANGAQGIALDVTGLNDASLNGTYVLFDDDGNDMFDAGELAIQFTGVTGTISEADFVA